jgi:hypothetical protein
MDGRERDNHHEPETDRSTHKRLLEEESTPAQNAVSQEFVKGERASQMSHAKWCP